MFPVKFTIITVVSIVIFRPSLKCSIKFKDWDDFKARKGDYYKEYTSAIKNKNPKSNFGPPIIAGYFGDDFGKVPCNIVRPVRPQYQFYKALKRFEGKYIDELSYKVGDLIKYLGIELQGRIHNYYYNEDSEDDIEDEKKSEILENENIWRLGELNNGEIGFYPVNRSQFTAKSIKHNQELPLHQKVYESSFFGQMSPRWKPTFEWKTFDFEDYRRFHPKATVKYDFMMIRDNYDPKMDKLFDSHDVDVFHEMRAKEIVKVLRY